MNIRRVFSLDQLPITFATELIRKDDGCVDRAPLSNAIKDIIEIIWNRGGFRFRQHSIDWLTTRY